MTRIDGPRRPPASGGRARQLVVLLHGYGADGDDLFELSVPLSRAMPHAAFVAPHAPEPCRASPMGRQWFDLTFRDPDEYVRGVAAAVPGLARFLEAELARHGLGPDALALVGFSQGTMMALGVGLAGGFAPGGIVGFSGLLALPADVRAETVPAVPVFLVHGTADEVLPAGHTVAAAARLGSLGCLVEWHLVPGLGHGIDPKGLSMAADYLAKLFRS